MVKVTHFHEAPTYEPEAGWRRVSLCGQPSVSLEYFVKPPGHASPMHEHDCDQVCVVLEGRLSIRTADGREELLDPGDAAFLPAGEAHLVINPLERPSMGLDIFSPGRRFDFWTSRSRPKG